jgi:hypothetical protein
MFTYVNTLKISGRIGTICCELSQMHFTVRLVILLVHFCFFLALL